MIRKHEKTLLAAALVLVLLAAVCIAALTPEGRYRGLEGEPPMILPLGPWQMHLPMFFFCLTGGLGLAALAWQATRQTFLLHRMVLLLALLGGTMGVLCRPAMELSGWDEGVHRGMALIFSGYDGYGITDYMAQFSTWFFGYLPYTAGIALGNILQLPQHILLRMGSLAGVMVYAFAVSRAVKITPRFKLTFAFFALLPTCLAIAGFISYDGGVIACVLVALALLLRELARPDKLLSPLVSLGMAALLALGTLPKPAYSPLLLLLWLLPKSKFASRSRQVLHRLFVLALLLLCLYSMTLGMYDDILAGDLRMDDTDSAGQVAYILSKPGAFLAMFGRYLLREGLGLFTSIGAWWGLLKDPAPVFNVLIWLLMLACPLCSLEEKDAMPALTPGRRVWLGLWACVPLVALMVTQYIVSTPVAHFTIDGMQARYTLPVMPLLALALMLPQPLREKTAPASKVIAVLLLAILWLSTFASAWLWVQKYC